MFKWFVKKINNRKGFTLVELIVVIAILGILATLAVPRFTGATKNANRKVVEANLRTIDGAIAMYEADKGAPPSSEGELTNETNGTLQSWPEGPDGVEYELDTTSNKAKAKKGANTKDWFPGETGKTVSLPITWSTEEEPEA